MYIYREIPKSKPSYQPYNKRNPKRAPSERLAQQLLAATYHLRRGKKNALYNLPENDNNYSF